MRLGLPPMRRATRRPKQKLSRHQLIFSRTLRGVKKTREGVRCAVAVAVPYLNEPRAGGLHMLSIRFPVSGFVHSFRWQASPALLQTCLAWLGQGWELTLYGFTLRLPQEGAKPKSMHTARCVEVCTMCPTLPLTPHPGLPQPC